MTDLIDDILGIVPGSPLAALRARRPEARQHAQGAFQELLMPADPGGISRQERAALALRVALRGGDAALAARYRALLDTPLPEAEDLAPPQGQSRMAVLLRHADTVATDPAACGKPEIEALVALGLTSRDIVALTQLIAFVPFQIRLLAGLRQLAA